MITIMHSIYDHKNAYLLQMNHTIGYLHATFLLTARSLSHRYSLLEATHELGMRFLHEGNKCRLYLTIKHRSWDLCLPILYWVHNHKNMLCSALPYSSELPSQDSFCWVHSNTKFNTNAFLDLQALQEDKGEEKPRQCSTASHYKHINQTSSLGIHNTYPCNTRKTSFLFSTVSQQGLSF